MKIEEQELSVARYLFTAHEIERQRLGQELHDGLLQELYSLDFALVGFAPYLQGGQTQADWQELRGTLQRVSRRLRAICQSLRPPALGPFGLAAALRSYIEKFQEMHPEIRIHEELMDDGERFSEEMRLMIYRFCEHMLDNVVQHADAENVEIRLYLNGTKAIFTVEDDGRGVELPADWIEIAREGRYGLFGYRERALALGGELNIESAPGQGFLAQLILPVSAEGSIS
jgi:signal transduction histidine kinase